MTKFTPAKFKKNVLSKLYQLKMAHATSFDTRWGEQTENVPEEADSKDKSANNVAPHEAAHHELPHVDLHCLQIQLFLFLAF